MNRSYLNSALRSYRTALELCEGAARQGPEALVEIASEFDEMKRAYHYARRYLPFAMGAKQSQWPSLKLAYDILLDIAERGYDGVQYTTGKKRYQPYRASGPGSAKGWDQVYSWEHDMCQLPAAAEKLASSIRRVKASTKREALAWLFT